MTIRDQINYAIRSPWGRAVASFLRVFLATFVAGWVEAGIPVFDMTMGQVADWFTLGVQAAVLLTVANTFGPWEKRYGVHKTSAADKPE